MCQEPTELLWICCLTGLIWTPGFKFVPLTPNINSQTFWSKQISHVMNGTILFICSTSAISAPLAALRIAACQAAPAQWRRGCRSKKKKKELWQNRNLQQWTCLISLRQVPPPQQVRWHVKVRRCRHLRGNPTAGWELIQTHTAHHTEAVFSKVRKSMDEELATYGWLGREHGYFGKYLWIPLFEQQFISNKTMHMKRM